jgi:hypothetical protein
MLALLAAVSLLATSACALVKGDLVERQSTPSEADCAARLLPIVTTIPKMPPSIEGILSNFAMTATKTEDFVCGWQTAIPSSLYNDFNSYQSSVISWQSAHSAEIKSAMQGCPTESSGTGAVCSITFLPVGAAPPTPTGTSGTGGGSGNGNTPKNMAAKDTGFLALAAVAAAGVLGVVAAL